MITGRDIILISSVEWSFLWQHPQEIALRLAEAGNRVLYIENTGVRSPGFRDARRVALRLQFWANSLTSRGAREVRPGVYVCSPLVLPPFGPIWRRQINRRLFLPLVRRAARKLGMRDPILWSHLPTNTAADLIRLLRTPKSVVVYYCIADFAQLTPHVEQLRRSEKGIVQTSDLVFANSEPLAEHCRQWREQVHVFPPGLNLRAFPPPENGTAALEDWLPAAQRRKAEAVIGYVGGLHRYVDLDLVTTMARDRPRWCWVFVGPAQTQLRELSRLPNVVLLGQRPHQELAGYINSFDVCIVPYLNNGETATIVPVKINEYLASGKPVVSTDLPAVLDFNRQHQILTTAEARPEVFLDAIERALKAPNGDGVIARRREVAALNDWHQRLGEMSRLIEIQDQVKVAGSGNEPGTL
jgi:glycosyltransferase involved in cell wall biosynthesis